LNETRIYSATQNSIKGEIMTYTWKWASIIALIVIVVGYLWQRTQTEVSALAAAAEVPTAVADTIRQVTVQITMIRTQWSEPTPAGSGQTNTSSLERHRDKGIGTLLAYQGETLLISHDHWSYFTSTVDPWTHAISTVVPDLVQFHDADGRFLLEMTGYAFSQLMLFHDGGTLIMFAPQSLTLQLSSTATLGHIASLQTGDIVYVAHRQANHNDTVVLMAAEVLAIEFRNNIPLLSLRSLNGQTIEPGDSGGGVWLDGRFVGNLWTTVIKVHQEWWQVLGPVETTTVRSQAAGLTGDFLELISHFLGS
jgi:hypothetical protein